MLPNPEVEVAINLWLTGTQAGREKKINYQKTVEGVVYDDGVLKLTAIPTRHCPGSHAYVLEAEGKTVLCTGDLSRPSEDFPWVEKPLDLLICESAHFPTTDYLPVLAKIEAKKVCVTHYSPKRMVSLYQFQQEMAERGNPIVIATDDLELNV